MPSIWLFQQVMYKLSTLDGRNVRQVDGAIKLRFLSFLTDSKLISSSFPTSTV